MFVTFILGIIAGWGAPMAEDVLKGPLQKALSGDLTPIEMRAASLSICLLIAAVLGLIVGSGSALALTLGAVIGVLGARMMERFRTMRAPDYDS